MRSGLGNHNGDQAALDVVQTAVKRPVLTRSTQNPNGLVRQPDQDAARLRSSTSSPYELPINAPIALRQLLSRNSVRTAFSISGSKTMGRNPASAAMSRA